MSARNRTPRRWTRILTVVLLLLVVAGVVGALAMDRFLTSAARRVAAGLATQWGRPVEVDGVRTAFLGGLGVRVDGVRIGAAPGETGPLLELDRAEVKLGLLRALLSGGQDVRVRSVELQGLRATVERLRDGSTNVQALADAMARGAGPMPAGPAPVSGPERPPSDLSSVRVEHAALRGGRIAFLDGAAGGRALAVDQIDLVMDGLAAGAPLDLVLKAGVLSTAQNLELRVHAPALPPSLIPAPDRITLKVAPVDLTPLAAFAPGSVGFLGGRLSADLEVALGAAVPGGAGPVTLRGGFAATGLRFSGQRAGRTLDVTLDADVVADVLRGDLAVNRLVLAIGPAALEGRGKVVGLRSEHPVVEGLQVLSRQLDLATLAATFPALPALLGGTVEGPIALALEATGAAAQPAVEIRVDLTPVRMALAGRLSKAAGGRLGATARIRGGPGGSMRFDVEADLGGLDLRPGGALAKGPGDRFRLAATGALAPVGEGRRVDLETLNVALLDMALKARGRIELAPSSTRFDVEVDIDRLDLDRLLRSRPEGEGVSRPAASAAAPAIPAGVPTPGPGPSGRCIVRIGEVQAHQQRARDLRVTVTVRGVEVTVDEGRLAIWGGFLDLAGTRVRLAPADRPFSLVARAEGIQVGSALATWSDRKVLEGRLDAQVRLTGKGEDGEAIRRSLDGTIEGRLADGVFHGADLVAGVEEPLVKAVPGLQGRVTRAGKTSLGRVVPVSLKLEGGRALLQKPLEIQDRGATATVHGAIGLDGELDLPVALVLPPAVLADLTGGKATIDSPLPFSFTLQGKAWSPRLSGLDVGPAARRIAETLGLQALGQALGLGRSPAGAAPESKPAPAPAKEAAEKARKKAEKDAKKLLKGLLGG